MKLYKDDLDIAARRAVQHRENEEDLQKAEYQTWKQDKDELESYEFNPWSALVWVVGILGSVFFTVLGIISFVRWMYDLIVNLFH